MVAPATPVHVDRAFGLPAHPLLLHVPVILDPMAAVGALAFVVRPAWRERWGLALAVLAVASLPGTVLTVGAGEALLRDDFGGVATGTLADHREAARTLRIVMFAFVASLLALLVADLLRRAGRDLRGTVAGLAVVTAALALASGFYTVRTGHLGAKATWGDVSGSSSGS
jgi:hypothetical protein